MLTLRWRLTMAVGLALCGCQAPALAPVVLTDHGERLLASSPVPDAATLTALVGDDAAAYRTQYLRVLDWSVAEGTLSNTDASFVPLVRSIGATVDAENRRRASLSFSPLKAGGGYSLHVALKRPALTGTPVTVASGTVSGLTFVPGNNPVSVPVTPTSDGHLAVALPNPEVPPPLIEPAGITSLVAGTGGTGSTNGSLSSATFTSPHGLAIRGTSLYVADSAAHAVRLVDLALSTGSAGYVSLVAGAAGVPGYVDGAGSAARFDAPLDMAFRSNGHMVIADSGNHVIRLIDTNMDPSHPSYVRTVAGSGAVGNADGSGGLASFVTPAGLALNGAGQLFVADIGSHRIRMIDLSQPMSSATYVTTFAGSGTAASVDGTGTGASFNEPVGLAFDGSGNLYVAESGGMRIRKVTPAGVVTTLVGGTSGIEDGKKAQASFGRLRDLVYRNDRLYVTDANHTLRVVRLDLPPSDANFVDTVAGVGGVSGYLEGPGSFARFFTPHGMTLGGDGTLYVVDRGNRRIRKVL